MMTEVTGESRQKPSLAAGGEGRGRKGLGRANGCCLPSEDAELPPGLSGRALAPEGEKQLCGT